MNSVGVSKNFRSYFSPLDVGGSSDEAASLNDALVATIRHFRLEPASSNLTKLVDRLDEIVQECSIPNWDGYGAVPIPLEAIHQAEGFAVALPSQAPRPEILPEPDGDVEFEWYAGKEHMVSVSVSANGTLSYFARFGPDGKARGTEIFDGKIPWSIITAIHRAMPSYK